MKDLTMTTSAGPAHTSQGDRAPAKRWHWVVLAAALAFLAFAGWSLYTRVFAPDSGVTACKTMRDNTTAAASKKTDDSPLKISDKDYLKWRGEFARSRQADIRDHGTKFMDLIWTVSKASNQTTAMIGYASQLRVEQQGLQSACADQGVTFTMAS